MRARRIVLIAIALATLAVGIAALADQPAAELAGHWEGEIELPGGELPVKVDLEVGEPEWSGTVDIPAQGAFGLPLAAIVVQGTKVRFSIDGIPGNPTFDGEVSNGELVGTFSQGGSRLPFRLGREEVPPPARPQNPVPPFPYGEEAVEYSNGAIRLAATLTLPTGDGPFPAALLSTGSGPQNRDEELLGHKPFLVLADHLARKGIAVLRADDRGVGDSTGNVADSTSSDFADDALSGVAYLRSRAEIDTSAIGLIGHSEGGLVAPLAATRSKSVRFLILLAGPGVPGAEILVLQTERIATANGAPPSIVRRQVGELRQRLAHFDRGLSEEELREALLETARRQTELPASDDEQTEAIVQAQVNQMLSRWFRFFLTYDPAPTLSRVEVPVLALNGELDLQVAADQNLAAIGAALEAADNPDVTVGRLTGLNHLFQSAETGSPSEYHAIEETFAPAALDRISSWILARFGETG